MMRVFCNLFLFLIVYTTYTCKTARACRELAGIQTEMLT